MQGQLITDSEDSKIIEWWSELLVIIIIWKAKWGQPGGGETQTNPRRGHLRHLFIDKFSDEVSL